MGKRYSEEPFFKRPIVILAMKDKNEMDEVGVMCIRRCCGQEADVLASVLWRTPGGEETRGTWQGFTKRKLAPHQQRSHLAM